MNIVPTTKSITEYALTLSEKDAAEILIDPYSFADRLAGQLREAGAGANGTANGRKPRPESHIKFGHGRRPNGHAAGRKAKRPNGSRGGLGKVACPDCGKPIAEKYLPLHRSKKHAASQPAEASASAA